MGKKKIMVMNVFQGESVKKNMSKKKKKLRETEEEEREGREDSGLVDVFWQGGGMHANKKSLPPHHFRQKKGIHGLGGQARGHSQKKAPRRRCL